MFPRLGSRCSPQGSALHYFTGAAWVPRMRGRQVPLAQGRCVFQRPRLPPSTLSQGHSLQAYMGVHLPLLLCQLFSQQWQETVIDGIKSTGPCWWREKGNGVYIHTMEYYSAVKRRKSNNMDETGWRCAKWNKPDRQRQIPSVITYMWNLKKKKLNS